MNIINLTPHDIRVRFHDSAIPEAQDGDIVFPSSKISARIEQTSVVSESVNGIPVMRSVFGAIVGLPDPQPDTIYVVSLPVAQQAAMQGRNDVVSPDTNPKGGAIRYGEGPLKGQPFAVRGFQMF